MFDQAPDVEHRIDGIDVDARADVVDAVERDPSKGIVGLRVASAWKGRMRSESTVESYAVGGERVDRFEDPGLGGGGQAFPYLTGARDCFVAPAETPASH